MPRAILSQWGQIMVVMVAAVLLATACSTTLTVDGVPTAAESTNLDSSISQADPQEDPLVEDLAEISQPAE